MRQKESGFTLIELLVVIAIISLLSSIVLASLNSARAKARDTKRIVEKRQVITALNAYYADNGAWPPSASNGNEWSCLAPGPERCWGDAYIGLNDLVTAVTPYLPTLPTNNAPSGTNAYNRLLYRKYHVLSPPQILTAGAYLIWVQETNMSAGKCPNIAEQYGTYYYCYEYLGP